MTEVLAERNVFQAILTASWNNTRSSVREAGTSVFLAEIIH